MNGKQAKRLRKAALTVGSEREYDSVSYTQVNQLMKKWKDPLTKEERTFFTYTRQMLPSVRKLYKQLKKSFYSDKLVTLKALGS